jgi:hypothetical protein
MSGVMHIKGMRVDIGNTTSSKKGKDIAYKSKVTIYDYAKFGDKDKLQAKVEEHLKEWQKD